ncbi:MAG: ATP phosphoribosyltransferase [Gemmatimonadetes bacterium]|nr:ATP phosphoribosyltransferase [Gemmatimonadota bacterium]
MESAFVGVRFTSVRGYGYYAASQPPRGTPCAATIGGSQVTVEAKARRSGETDEVRVAIPNKGRLREHAIKLLRLAGVGPRFVAERSLAAPMAENFQAIFVRAGDIPAYVADGAAEAGITGHDLVRESGRELDELLDLGFGSCKLVVAVKEESAVEKVRDLAAGTRVATSFPRLTKEFFAGEGLPATVVPVSGAAEIAPHLGVADAIVDLSSTGSTLRLHGLREIDSVLRSTARLVARPDPSTNSALSDLATAIESVIRGRAKRYLMANVPRTRIDEVRNVLPGLSGPTTMRILNSDEWLAVHAVVEAESVFRVVARLKALGAQGIVVTTIERLMP